jgi:hypothetical protein
MDRMDMNALKSMDVVIYRYKFIEKCAGQKKKWSGSGIRDCNISPMAGSVKQAF